MMEQVGMTGISRRVEKTGTEARTEAEAAALDDRKEAARDLTNPKMMTGIDEIETAEDTATIIAIVTGAGTTDIGMTDTEDDTCIERISNTRQTPAGGRIKKIGSRAELAVLAKCLDVFQDNASRNSHHRCCAITTELNQKWHTPWCVIRTANLCDTGGFLCHAA